MSRSIVILVARLMFAGLFALAAMTVATGLVEPPGDDLSLLVMMMWLSLVLHIVLALSFLTGAYFAESALAGAVFYALLLVLGHFNPAQWASTGNASDYAMVAALLFAAACGPGDMMALRAGRLWRR